jgi:hypothetical protein
MSSLPQWAETSETVNPNKSFHPKIVSVRYFVTVMRKLIEKMEKRRRSRESRTMSFHTKREYIFEDIFLIIFEKNIIFL